MLLVQILLFAMNVFAVEGSRILMEFVVGWYSAYL